MFKSIKIRPETHKDYKEIISLVLRSFQEGTEHSDGTDIIALIEEIRDSEYYIPELSFVAEIEGKIVGHFLFSKFPLASSPEGDYHFYNKVGFITSSEYKIYPTSGYALTEPRCQMCMETYQGSLKDKAGYIIYDMYYNA